MRKRNRAFLSCAILAGVLLAAVGAAADECTAGSYSVTTTGPSFVSCGSNCTATQITYTVSGAAAPDHVATVVASGSDNCLTPSILDVTGTPASGNQKYDPGVGDPVTGLGKWACHEEAAKINPQGSVTTFTVKVSGARSPAPKSVAVKKGSKIASCEIVGIGEQGSVAPTLEITKEGNDDCAIEVTKDRLTGSVLHVQLTADSHPDCTFVQTDIGNLSIEVNTPVGTCTDPPCRFGVPKYGQGFTNAGCSQQYIGGKLYVYGRPCP